MATENIFIQTSKQVGIYYSLLLQELEEGFWVRLPSPLLWGHGT